MKNVPLPQPAVMIVWRDACAEEASTAAGECISGLVELTEVGFLLAESEESVTIGMELAPDVQPGRWRLHIPKSCIVSQTELTAGGRGRKR